MTPHRRPPSRNPLSTRRRRPSSSKAGRSADTDGESVLFECFVQPSGFVAAAAHVHPFQQERFQVIEGSVTFRLDGRELTVGPGDAIYVPAGMSHQFWNAGEEEARFACEVRPALQFEELIVQTMFSLAQAGRKQLNRKGMPDPLRLAVIARARIFSTLAPITFPACVDAAGRGWRSARRSGGCSATGRHMSARPRRGPARSRRHDAPAMAEATAALGGSPARTARPLRGGPRHSASASAAVDAAGRLASSLPRPGRRIAY